MSVQGRVVWHDLNTSNVEQAKGFYGELFGWRFESQHGMTFIHVGSDKDHCGTVMALDKSRNLPSHWLPYFAVNNLDTAVTAVTKSGGKIHMAKQAVPKAGEFAVAADPQHATFVLWQYSEQMPKAEVDGNMSLADSAGRICWDELLTPDPAAAEKFYSSVIGYKTESMEMGGGMKYTLFLRDEKRPDGKPRQGAGMMKMPPMVPHPFWLSYVAVKDCDQSMEKAKKLGATITMPPTEIPNIGRFSTMLDPTNAPIAIIGPNK
jgi:predicted enzyme related to lactoylglutathione lyase